MRNLSLNRGFLSEHSPYMGTLIATLTAIALGSMPFKCAIPEVVEASSNGGRIRMRYHREGRLAITSGGRTATKKLEIPGHHLQIAFNVQGDRIVAIDPFEGIVVIGSKGSVIRTLDADGIVPRPNRTDAWACHPEGVWLRRWKSHGETIRLELSDGRTADLRILDGTLRF